MALPSRGGQPLPSPELLIDVEDGADAELGIATWQVAGRLLPPEQALRWLASLPERDRLPPAVALGADLRFWRLAARFQLSLLARQRFVPSLLADQPAAAGKGQAAQGSQSQSDLPGRLAALADAVVGAGEGWLTELSTADLRQLLTLRKDAAG